MNLLSLCPLQIATEDLLPRHQCANHRCGEVEPSLIGTKSIAITFQISRRVNMPSFQRLSRKPCPHSLIPGHLMRPCIEVRRGEEHLIPGQRSGRPVHFQPCGRRWDHGDPLCTPPCNACSNDCGIPVFFPPFLPQYLVIATGSLPSNLCPVIRSCCVLPLWMIPFDCGMYMQRRREWNVWHSFPMSLI